MTTIIKPLLAKDVDESKLKFPVAGMVKIDGSWGAIQNGKLFARSLKPHENKFTTARFSKPEFEGLRGELILGNDPAAENLCRDTSSALRRIEGEPEITMWCFDYVTEETKDLPYKERHALMVEKVSKLGVKFINSIGYAVIKDFEEYAKYRNNFLSLGFEGIIIRDLTSKHKEGRSSSVKADLWRYKPWSSAEIRVKYLVEEQKNNNEAKTNDLGRTERSTHKENLEGKGTMGAIVGVLETPLLDYQGTEIAQVGTEITIATGSLKEKECQFYWDNQHEIVEKLVEFEYMSYGLKDKPRFAQFKRIRSENDL